MKNLGSISDPKSTTTKEYVDNRVVANPQSSSTPTELEKLTIGGLLYEPRKVIANPTLAGTEAALSGIQIGNTKYNMGSQSNIATVETGTTATKAYVAGEYVVVGGQLYRVTAAIASGGTFTPGTNVSATSVGSRLQSIETAIQYVNISRYNCSVDWRESYTEYTFSVPSNSAHILIVAGTVATYRGSTFVGCDAEGTVNFTTITTSGQYVSVYKPNYYTNRIVVRLTTQQSSHSTVSIPVVIFTLNGNKITRT